MISTFLNFMLAFLFCFVFFLSCFLFVYLFFSLLLCFYFVLSFSSLESTFSLIRGDSLFFQYSFRVEDATDRPTD